ncbi:MAG: hypothetical protein M1827_001541 [Pycnora praestabilis]|nr:MAG: hypothetical protein M1827_001541 [Pycnora praestabilis]
MPHKHTREKSKDGASYELPPTTFAKPLPVTKSSEAQKSDQVARKIKAKARKRSLNDGFEGDDTPKSFARLMQFQATGRHPDGLDDGNALKKSKKRKREDLENKETTKVVPNASKSEREVPTIQPGERMSEFAARVDAALPVSGLASKGRDPLGLKPRRTKTEKKMHRMYAEWREEEARRKEKAEDAREDAEEEEEEKGITFEDKTASLTSGKKNKKKGKKRRVIGEEGDDEDPWAAIKREDGPRGLHDVVQAPPHFSKVPKAKFGVKNGARVEIADVPNRSGSLRKREELGEARKNIVAEYRRMMEDRRGNAALRA